MPRKRHYLCSLFRLCRRQSGSSHKPFCAELCLDTTVNKKKKTVQLKGQNCCGRELCVYGACDSVFPPAAPLGPGRVCSGKFSTEKASLSHEMMTSPLNLVYKLLPRCTFYDLQHIFHHPKGVFLTPVGQREKKFEIESAERLVWWCV